MSECTAEETKAYLEGYRNLEYKIKCLNEQHEAVKLDLESVKSINYDELPKAQNVNSGLDNIIIKLYDLKQEINETYIEMLETKIEISNSIARMSEGIECTLLYMRYIKCMNWEDIAETLGYSESQIYRIHNRALKLYQELKNNNMR